MAGGQLVGLPARKIQNQVEDGHAERQDESVSEAGAHNQFLPARTQPRNAGVAKWLIANGRQ